jgi:hypothetical protein
MTVWRRDGIGNWEVAAGMDNVGHSDNGKA